MTIQRTVIIERVEASPPMSDRQLHVIGLLESGLSPQQTADHLGIGRNTVHWYVRMAAKQIPGDLPAAARLVAWFRGAPLYVLEGLRSTQARQLRESMAERNRVPGRTLRKG